jgi:hypothetical protein
MIRTSITPQQTDILLSIPENYVGKKIEIIYYAVDEITEDIAIKTNTMARFKGILSSEETKQLQEYVKQSRAEWDRNI